MLANPSIRTIAHLPFTKDIDVKLLEAESADHVEDISLPLENLALNTTTAYFPTKDYAAIHAANQQTSPLLALPRELRDLIITQVVISSPHPHNANSDGLPPLLQTSTQLRHETASIYYHSKLLLAGGAPSPYYEKHYFDGFDPNHLQFLRRVHWLYESFGTRDDAMKRAGELDRLSGLESLGIKGVWTVGFLNVLPALGKGRAVYVNCWGEVVPPAEF